MCINKYILAIEVVGVGGIFIDPRGKSELSYNCELGTSSNNQEETYALLQGLRLVVEERIKSLIVVGHSNIIIKFMHMKVLPADYKLSCILV